MGVSIRPRFATGAALVGATAIALAPVSAINPHTAHAAVDMRAATAAVSTEFQLTASEIPYILTLPVVRQYIVNWAENWQVYLAGLAQSGVGLVDSLLAIPGVTVEILQELLALDFVGAFDTFGSAVRDSVIAVGQPLLDSLIWRNQKYYAVQTALQAAVPQAFIDITNGFLTAANGVTTSVIAGTQNLVAAALTLNLSAIVDAAIEGTQNFFVALGEGGSAIVDGIEAAQLGIATALATDPPTPPPATSDAAVAATGTPAAATTIGLARGSDAVTLDVGPAQEHSPTPEAGGSVLADSARGLTATAISDTGETIPASQEEATDDADEAGAGTEADADVSAVTEAPSSSDASRKAPPRSSKKAAGNTPAKEMPKRVVPNDKPGTRADGDAGGDRDAKTDAKTDAGTDAKTGAGTDAKSASEADDE